MQTAWVEEGVYSLDTIHTGEYHILCASSPNMAPVPTLRCGFGKALAPPVGHRLYIVFMASTTVFFSLAATRKVRFLVLCGWRWMAEITWWLLTHSNG